MLHNGHRADEHDTQQDEREDRGPDHVLLLQRLGGRDDVAQSRRGVEELGDDRADEGETGADPRRGEQVRQASAPGAGAKISSLLALTERMTS